MPRSKQGSCKYEHQDINVDYKHHIWICWMSWEEIIYKNTTEFFFFL